MQRFLIYGYALICALILYPHCIWTLGPPHGSKGAKGSQQQQQQGQSQDAQSSNSVSSLSSHTGWTPLDESVGGSSTLEDGSHNPNEIVGWGAASASAWEKKEKPAKPSADDQQQQQPMSAGGAGYGYQQQQPSYGYGQQQQQQQQQPSYGYGYSSGATNTGYGYSSGATSSGYGYSSGSTGYGYSAAAPQQPSSGYGYSSGATSSSGYSASGFGYSAPQSSGYDAAATSGGQMPGGGALPGGKDMQAAGGQQQMGAPGQGQQQMPGAKGGKPLPGGAQQQGAPMGGQTKGMSDKCPLPHRHRKPWSLMTNEQKDMFIDGFQQVRKNGKLDVIAQTHAQHDIQNYVHYTSLFTFYHAYLVWELETAIRDLGGKFACFTMPYYDWTLDAGLEDDPTILKSGIGGDGDIENSLCVKNDDSGFTWNTCSDYSPWRTVDESEDNSNNDDENVAEGEGEPKAQPAEFGEDGISYTGYDEDTVFNLLSAHYISYGDAYDVFTPRDDSDPNSKAQIDGKDVNEEAESEQLQQEEAEDEDGEVLEAEAVEEQCYWTQANCMPSEKAPFCCLKRKKSTTVILPTAAEIGDAMYRSKNIKEWQGYLGEYYNKVMSLYGADYFAQVANGYATEDPIFWMTHSFITHLRSLWQDCWNYNNIPKDKLDMHYNSYHPYCGTFDAVPSDCPSYNLALDAPMNFYELQKQDWSLANHKIVTVRKMWTPEYWNVVYELGPFYTTSGLNLWCDNTRDSEWFLETMDYDVEAVHTDINVFSQRLREKMVKDGVEQTGIFKTVSSLTCQYNRKYSANSCWSEEMLDLDIDKCDKEEIENSELDDLTLDDFLDYDGVGQNECLKKIRRETFAYSEHAKQVKKQLCAGDWDYECPEYNELLYGEYASFLDNPISQSFEAGNGKKGFFAKSGWIWMIVINGILVIIVGTGCGIWHCSRSNKNVKTPLLRDENGDIIIDATQDSHSEHVDIDNQNDANIFGTIQPTQDVEEYQPLLV